MPNSKDSTSWLFGLMATLACVACVSCSDSFLAKYSLAGTFIGNSSQATLVSSAHNGEPDLVTCTTGELEFSWRISDYGTRLNVGNRSNGPIEIRWVSGAFIDDKGASHDLTVTSVPIGGKSISSSEVPGGEALEVWVFPRSYSIERDGKWYHTRTLFDPPGYRVGRTRDEIVAITTPVVGKTMGWRFPISVRGSEQVYEFEFVVTGVDGQRRLLT